MSYCRCINCTITGILNSFIGHDNCYTYKTLYVLYCRDKILNFCPHIYKWGFEIRGFGFCLSNIHNFNNVRYNFTYNKHFYIRNEVQDIYWHVINRFTLEITEMHPNL